MTDKLTDSEIVKALEQCEMQQTCSYCQCPIIQYFHLSFLLRGCQYLQPTQPYPKIHH